MKTSSALSKALLVCAMSAAVTGFVTSAQADDGKEKCYGVAKAGKNDCKGVSNACAGHAAKDGEGFVAVPKGLCEKLVGGTTTAPKS